MTTTKAAVEEYRWIGNYPWEAQLSNGARVMLEPGGFIKLSQTDLEDPYNAEVLDDGLLIPVEGGK